MIFSEKTARTLALLSTLAALSASCARKVSPNAVSSQDLYGDSPDATFVVAQPVKLVQATLISNDTDWSVPSANRMTFQACLKDVAKDEPIVNQTFEIRGEDGTQRVTTDPTDGCLNWTETIPFDYLQHETYVETLPEIVGLGPHRGVRHVPLAVDPWKEDPNALRDLRQGSVKPLLHGKSVQEALHSEMRSTSENQSPAVRVERVLVESNDIRYQNNDATVALHLALEPKITRRDLSGNIVLDNLISGQFDLALTLIERKQEAPAGNSPGPVGDSAENDQYLILSQSRLPVRIEKGLISVDLPLELKHKPLPSSLLEMAIRLVPKHAPFEILPEEGVIQLSSLHGGGYPALRHLSEPLEVYLDNARHDTLNFESRLQAMQTQAPACSDGSEELGFYIKGISVANQGVTAKTRNEGVPSQVLAGYSVCLADSLDSGKVLADRDFDVTITGSSKGEVHTHSLHTDAEGCLHWTDPVNFDYFAAENWTGQTLRIVSHEAPYQNVSREFPIWIDPWSKGQRFFWDCRRGEKPTFNTQPARMEMIDFIYNFQGRDLKVDSNLNLTLERHYQFKLTPRIVRHQGYGGLTTYESIQDGRYILRTLVLAPDHDQDTSKVEGSDIPTLLRNFKYLSSDETIAQARDGRIVTEITLPIQFSELPLLASRNLILIQLVPLNEHSSLISPPFYSPFVPAVDFGMYGLVSYNGTDQSNSFSTRPKAMNLDLKALMAMGKESKTRLLKANNSLDDFAAKFGFKRPSQKNISDVGITNDMIESMFLSNTIDLDGSQRLCRLLQKEFPELGKKSSSSGIDCTGDPRGELQIARTQHVESVMGTPTVVDSSYSPMTVNAGLQINQSVTDSKSDGKGTSTSIDVNAKAGASFSFFDIINIGGGVGWSKGKNWFKSTQTSLSRAESASSGVNFSRNFEVEKLTLQLYGGGRDCVIARAQNSNDAGLLLCAKEMANGNSIQESYYLLTELVGTPAAALRDIRSLADSPWIKAIRGTAAFEAMRKVLVDGSRTLVLRPDRIQPEKLDHVDELMDNFAKTTPEFSDGAFPSVIYQK